MWSENFNKIQEKEKESKVKRRDDKRRQRIREEERHVKRVSDITS